MDRMKHFDLESRKGRRLAAIIVHCREWRTIYFMNAAGQMDDVITMVHEGGHAIHSFCRTVLN